MNTLGVKNGVTVVKLGHDCLGRIQSHSYRYASRAFDHEDGALGGYPMTIPTPPPDSTLSLHGCFVIGPIGDKQAPFGSEERLRYERAIEIWDYVIEPACQALGIQPVRADRIDESGEITEQVCQRLRDDDLVIADVTEGNPNVMYELGMRHTKNKLTLQIGERGKLPFDIAAIRTIQFVRTETGLVEAREGLQRAIRTGIERGSQPVTATRVWLELNSPIPEMSEIVETEEQDEEPGFLDMLAEAEEALPLLARVAEELAAVFEELPAFTDEAMREMAASDARGGGAGGRLRVAKKLATHLEEPATSLEQLAADFVSELQRMSPGISYQIGLVEEEPSILVSNEGARQFADAIIQMAQAAEESLKQVDVLADVVQDFGKISSRLRPVTRRMSLAIRQISGSSRIIEEWGERLNSADSSGRLA